MFICLVFADRHSGATDDVKKAEEKKFKEIGEAYSVLSDPKKKARYDNGHDLEDLDGPAGFHGQLTWNEIKGWLQNYCNKLNWNFIKFYAFPSNITSVQNKYHQLNEVPMEEFTKEQY